jgi:hypothetical protein
VRWVVLLFAVNGTLLGLLWAQRRVPVVIFEAAEVAKEPTRIIFAQGAEVVRRHGVWHFVRPFPWPARSAALEDELWTRRGSGETVILGEGVSWDDFLDPHLIAEEFFPPHRIQVRTGPWTLHMEWDGAHWGGPTHGDPDEIRIGEWLRRLRRLTFREPVEELPTGEAAMEITLEGTFPDQRRHLKFFFAGGGETRVIVDEAHCFLCSGPEPRLLLAEVPELYSRRLFPGEIPRRVVLRNGSRTTVLGRGPGPDDPWVAIAPTVQDGAMVVVAAGPAQEMVVALRGLRWRRISDFQPPGPGESDPSVFPLELEVDGVRWLFTADGCALPGKGDRMVILEMAEVEALVARIEELSVPSTQETEEQQNGGEGENSKEEKSGQGAKFRGGEK